MKLVSSGSFDADRAREISPDLEIVVAESREQFLTEAVFAEIVIQLSADDFRRLLRESSVLRWAHTSSAGVDRYLCSEFLRSDVILTCAKDGPAGPNLAEHAFGLLLALSRNIGVAARSRTWRRSELSGDVFELGGKTLGVVGYGGVGREMAKRGLAFGMRVIATKKNHDVEAGSGITVLPSERLDELLTESDAVMIAVPDTPETVGLFDSDAFARMKSTAFIINVGRGTTIVTDDLCRALSDGDIAGAGLDVTDPEPLPDGHPLWSMGRVVITPHIAGAAAERGVRNLERVMENLGNFIAGRPMLSVVDKQAGY